jgi:hypothetical protein
MRINWSLLIRFREATTPKSKLLNINYEHLAKVLEAKREKNLL